MDVPIFDPYNLRSCHFMASSHKKLIRYEMQQQWGYKGISLGCICLAKKLLTNFRRHFLGKLNIIFFETLLAGIVSYMLGIKKSLKFFSYTFSILYFKTPLSGIFSVSTTVSDWLPGALSTRSIASSLLTGT